eukprot:jgi/Botrbrau1/20642/Bobra.113_1s0066.1
MESIPPAELAIAGSGIPSNFPNGLGYIAEKALAAKAEIGSVNQEGHAGQDGMQAMQATMTASVPEYGYTGSVPAAAPAREQLPLVPLPPANLSYVLSPLYGRPSGVVKPWDDGATWDALSGLRLWIGGCQDKNTSAPPVIVALQALYSSREGAVHGYGWGRAPDVEIRLQLGEQLVGMSGVFGQAIQQLTFVTSLGRTLGPYGANATTGSPFSFTGKVYSFAGANIEDLGAVAALAFWTDPQTGRSPLPRGPTRDLLLLLCQHAAHLRHLRPVPRRHPWLRVLRPRPQCPHRVPVLPQDLPPPAPLLLPEAPITTPAQPTLHQAASATPRPPPPVRSVPGERSACCDTHLWFVRVSVL